MFWQIVVAVISGFVGAMLRESVIAPIQEYKRVRRQISRDLVNYSDAISNPGSLREGRMAEAKIELRSDAAELRAVRDHVPSYIMKLSWAIPSGDKIGEAQDKLIRLSNSVHDPPSNRDTSDTVLRNDRDRERVRELLDLRTRSD